MTIQAHRMSYTAFSHFYINFDVLPDLLEGHVAVPTSHRVVNPRIIATLI